MSQQKLRNAGSSIEAERRCTLPGDASPVTCAWDKTGTRFASCMATGHVSIWERGDSNAATPSEPGKGNGLVCTASWQPHAGAITAAAWAPPDYGSVLAVCSEDGDASLWEGPTCSIDARRPEEAGGALVEWRLLTRLRDSAAHLAALAFGPHGFALKLVLAGADGLVRIYNSLEPMDLSKWEIEARFSLAGAAAVVAAGAGAVEAALAGQQPPLPPLLGHVCLAWCPTVASPAPSLGPSLPPPALAVGLAGGPRDGIQMQPCVKIMEFNEAFQRWQQVAELPPSALPGGGPLSPPLDVSWAPNIGGRGEELVAVAEGRAATVWAVDLGAEGGARPRRVANLEHPKGKVLQVGWDPLGLTLATSAADGVVRLWRANVAGTWVLQTAMGNPASLGA